MKTQSVLHSTPSSLGPFARLILTLTATREAQPVEDPEGSLGETPGAGLEAASDEPQATRQVSVSTHATTLGPFLTLLLTLHNNSSWIEREWWESSTAPRGAALAARYSSR
jgi:hypothetical protein